MVFKETRKERYVMKRPSNSFLVLFIFLFLTFFACARIPIIEGNIEESEVNEVNIEENDKKNITAEIKTLEEKIIQNIAGNYDIDYEIDIDGIKAAMDAYELQTNSNIVKINGCLYDLIIIEELLRSYNNIRNNWDNIRKEHIQKLTDEYIKAKMERKYMDSYTLSDAIMYYSYQVETADAFFPYLLEQFQLPDMQFDLIELPEKFIEVLPISITAINIDDIPYDSIAVETLQTQMRHISKSATQKIGGRLIYEINSQFDKCVNNVDLYLDWYYGFATGYIRIWEMGKGLVDPNRTAAGAMQEFMIKNYMEKIGYDVHFENIFSILQNGRNETIELALVFISVLEDCILDYGVSTTISENITGDQFMSSFIVLPDYLNTVVSEGLPIMGMGNKLDHEGMPLLEIANLIVNFIPGVGLIAGVVLDGITLKLTEHWKRPEFKEQIISSIRDTQSNLLQIVSFDHYI